MPAHELKVGGERVIWTLGGYLRLTHTSADKLKLGVGYIGDLPRESTMVFSIPTKRRSHNFNTTCLLSYSQRLPLKPKKRRLDIKYSGFVSFTSVFISP